MVTAEHVADKHHLDQAERKLFLEFVGLSRRVRRAFRSCHEEAGNRLAGQYKRKIDALPTTPSSVKVLQALGEFRAGMEREGAKRFERRHR